MNKRMDLNGTWKLRWYDGERGDRDGTLQWHTAPLERAWEATVPGDVHSEMMRLGLIQDPNEGLNILASRWVEETVWWYHRTFRAPKLAKGERAWLVFEALDLAAVIYLNGKEIGKHCNAFYPCRLEVTEHLKPGDNALLVRVESGMYHAMNRSADGYNVHLSQALTKRPWLRTVQSSHAWDWSPRLLNVGIRGNVYLETARDVRWDNLVVLSELSEDFGHGRVTARAFVEGLGDKPIQGTLKVEVVEAGLKVEAPVEIKPGLNPVEAVVEVPQPALWWPVGHGAQPRYTVRATLKADGKAIGAEERRIGFRHVRINQDKHPQAGTYFIIEINGKPIFCKGGNFVSADMIVARLDRKRYETLVNRLLEANGNFLRIWGGGLYESTDFYEICDEKGVLVWQEFIFACAKYPTIDPDFLADVKREAVHQVRRLAHHPGLIVWCGNNEMEMFNWGPNYSKGVAHPDYFLFHQVLPVMLKTEDPTRYYQPSSPYSPDHINPNRDDTGDQHPWSIGFHNTDFRGYRNMICRFSDEGGILGPTALPTVRACLSKGMERPSSFAFELHDNSVNFWAHPKSVFPADRMITQWLGRRIEDFSVEDWVYWGGVVQGEGLTEYVKNFRRRMFDSAAAVFWMYNDVWPATRSWTIVDYYLRRTPSFWPVRRAFAPVTVVVTREDDHVRIYGVNEGPDWTGDLRFGLMALAGGYPMDQTTPVSLPENASTILAEFDARKWDKLGENRHAAFALLSKDGAEVARDRMFLPLFKDIQWPKARVKVECKNGRAIFRSDTFAWRVCLDLDGERALPDNFFDVYPGVPTVLQWPARLGTPKILRIGNER